MSLPALNDILGIYCEGQVRQDTGQDKCTQPGREVLASVFLVLNLHILVTRYLGAPSNLAGVGNKKISFSVCLGLECGWNLQGWWVCGHPNSGWAELREQRGPVLVSTYQEGPEMGVGLPSSCKLREMIR